MNETFFYLLFGLFVLLLIICLLIKNRVDSKRNILLSQDLVEDDKTKSPTYFSEKYGIIGKPDAVREIKGEVIPIEHKHTRYKGKIYPSHKLQLAVYCLLIEENTGKRPSYGIIEYRDHQESIPYTKELKSSILTQIKKIRKENPEENDLPPVCDNMRKCSHCGYNYLCHTGQKRLL